MFDWLPVMPAEIISSCDLNGSCSSNFNVSSTRVPVSHMFASIVLCAVSPPLRPIEPSSLYSPYVGICPYILVDVSFVFFVAAWRNELKDVVMIERCIVFILCADTVFVYAWCVFALACVLYANIINVAIRNALVFMFPLFCIKCDCFNVL